MKNQLPQEGIIRRGLGEQDIPDMAPDVEGHSLLDQARLPIDQGVPGAPGSDSLLGQSGTGDDYKDDRGPDSL